jgi:hypothetical protein
MEQHPQNPPANNLPVSINESDFIRAIEASGYPLQGVVAEKLKGQFIVAEEWGYIDRDSKEHRSLDIYASKWLGGNDGEIQPGVGLLIECKRSQQPFVFFQNLTRKHIPHFPTVVGLPTGRRIAVSERSGGRTREVELTEATGLDQLPFVSTGPPLCSAFSKAIPSGKKVELSGSDAFNSVVLPLVKAQAHAVELFDRANNQPPHLPRILMGLGVLEAPMVLVEGPSAAAHPKLVPWVRVVRQEAIPVKGFMSDQYRFFVIDIVHADYFETFRDTHLMPFAESAAARLRERHRVILGGGVVDSLDNFKWGQIEPKK